MLLLAFCSCSAAFTVVVALAVAFLVARWLSAQTKATPVAPASAPAAASAKSRYGSVSSADFASPPADSSSSSSSAPPATAAQLESDLDPSELADYRAARYQTKLDCTTLKSFQLAAQADHRRAGGSRHSLSPSALTLATGDLLKAFPWYDGSSLELASLQRFRPVQMNTHCIFAKKSKCWGSGPHAASALGALPAAPVSVVDQTRAALPGLIDFTLKVKDAYPVLKEYSSASAAQAATDAGLSFSDPSTFFTADTKSLLTWDAPLRDYALDAFVLEVRGHSQSLDQFASTVRQVLCTISESDPVMPVRVPQEMDAYGVDVTAAQCMAPLLGKPAATPAAAAAASARADEVFSSARWHFSFLGETFFVTCFAGCYPRNHARYMFGAEAAAEREASGDGDPAHPLTDFEHSCFVLFQPELSFLRHNLSPDTAHTNWEAPRTERDRIRIAFRKADRAYVIPASISYPSAHYIVPPLQAFSGQVVRWWQKKTDEEQQQQRKDDAANASPSANASASSSSSSTASADAAAM